MNIFYYLLYFVICYSFDQTFFYFKMKQYCKKFKGKCQLCDCWSCPRKLYRDDYKGIVYEE